jgi:hypothetical protein
MNKPAPSFTQPGSEGRMSSREVTTLLGQPLICRLACHDAAGWPYVVPIWFEWDGIDFWIVPRQRSAWAHYLTADPRVALCIDVAETGARVICQGTADLIEEPNVGGHWVEIARRMAVRYCGEEGESYLQATLDQPRWLFRVRPKELTTWNGAGWHEKYAR